EIEGHCRRPQEICPRSLVIEALVAFGDGCPSPRCVERRPSEEVGAGFPSVVERQAAPHRARRLSLPRDDRLRADRVTLRRSPSGLMEPKSPTERGHLRSPRHAIFGIPAVRGLELLL